MKKIALLCCLAIVLMFALTILPSAADSDENGGEEVLPPTLSCEKSEYDLYVNGKPVTAENADNVLAEALLEEGQLPTVVYDHDSRTLTVAGTVELTDGTRMNNAASYSILSLGEEELDVVIDERAEVTLDFGVYIQCGSFSAVPSSKLIFSGDTLGSAAFVQVLDGEISFHDADISCEETLGITYMSEEIVEDKIPDGVGFAAPVINIENARLSVASSYRAQPLFAFLYSTESITVEGRMTKVRSTDNNYFADVFVYSDSSVSIADGDLSASGVGCIFDLPKANLDISGADIEGNTYFGMYLGGKCYVKSGATVSLKTVYGGVAIVGENAPTFEVSDSRFCVSAAKAPSAQPAGEGYLFRTHAWDQEIDAAIYAKGARVEFDSSTLDVSGHRFGVLYISQGERFSHTGQLNISADAIAFFATVKDESNVRFGSEIAGNVFVSSVHAPEILGEYGDYAVALVPNNGSLQVKTASKLNHITDVANVFSGYADDCSLTVREFDVALVVIPCIVLLGLTVLIVALYQGGFIVIGRRKKKNASVPEEETRLADDAGEHSTTEEKQDNENK